MEELGTVKPNIGTTKERALALLSRPLPATPKYSILGPTQSELERKKMTVEAAKNKPFDKYTPGPAPIKKAVSL